MLSKRVYAMTAGGADTPKITTGSVSDLRELTVPVTELVAKHPSPMFVHVVEDIRPIRDLVQRDMSGAKATNAKTKLPAYIDRKLSSSGDWSGPVWTFTVWLPEQLTRQNDEGATLGEFALDATNLGFYLDGESRALALEQAILDEHDPMRRRALLSIPVTIVIYDGIDVQRAAQHFRDTNGLGVGITSSLLLGHDYEDPWMAVTRRVFEKLGIPLEDQARQVKASGDAIMTVVAARTMVAAVARGVAAVQYGAGAIPTTEVDSHKGDGQTIDFSRLEKAAESWLGYVFAKVGVTSFKDKGQVVRAAPVIAALGALGRPFYASDLNGQLTAKAVLDSGIDWTVGVRWAGIAGKVNPAGQFSVGSGKENGYATFRALTDPQDPGYRSIRPAAAA
jgi:hypothetical protein